MEAATAKFALCVIIIRTRDVSAQLRINVAIYVNPYQRWSKMSALCLVVRGWQDRTSNDYKHRIENKAVLSFIELLTTNCYLTLA